MANFPLIKALGFSLYDILLSSWANTAQTYLSKAVNGDDGSDHVGFVSLGGLKTSQHEHKRVNVTCTGSNQNIAVNCNSYSLVFITGDEETAGTITLTYSNVRANCEYVVLFRVSETVEEADQTLLAWAGSGITHIFADASDQQPAHEKGAFTQWRGLALSTTEILWTRAEL